METHSYFPLLLKLWTVLLLLLFEVSGSLAESYKQYYIGCYIDGNPSRRLFGNHKVNIENMSPKACIELCKSKSYAYAGIQYGVECFCGNERPLFTARTDETECSTDCPGNKEEKCGAGWRTSAYKTGLTGTPPREKLNYIGCYSDFGSEDRRLFDKFQSDFVEGQTPHYCAGLCYALGYGYAALQYNFECFCGNNHPPSERLTNDEECGLECTGDKNEKCGGHWKLSVYSTSIPDIPALGRYIGCYIDNGDKRVFNGIKKDFPSRNNPQLCVNFCLRNNYQYAGLQYGRECYCGNDELTAGLVPDHQCEMECPGDDTRACGNHWRLAVYQLTIQFRSPQYLGCFKDESSEIRLFKGYQQNFYNSLTVQSCIDICRSKGFQYSGLQYRYQCFCEDRKPPNASLVGDNNCLYPCSGDSSQICGGDWRYSVYWNGFKSESFCY
ncbi:WSC domain-containing protein ARB_07867 [Nilaparvata lugens]|uniref:WSC domain-containing protein ARB_07867 n=1 Tax=Nilaparvata lugens TaxID=108931 RepID=UPI00193E7D5F|nr:WSC domain-containing protein ARB_07867 [Nilaparvata lugens]